ncbi:MAG TPA: S8 family serine peptidase, partial [Myxococcota bacterium]|nr:S8 family serine peptidase [Myxococcota bacterium]
MRAFPHALIAVSVVILAGVSAAQAASERIRSLRAPGRADARVYRLLRTPPPDASGQVPMFVRARDDEARRSLSTLGVKAELGRWTPVQLDRGAIAQALVSRGKLDLEVQPAHRPYLELSAREIGVTDVQAGIGVQSARTGRGVLVGIIDTGLDLRHTAFTDDDGRSRVIAVWDQDGRGAHPEDFDYGNECRESAIANGTCAIDDGNGHGTHV